MHRKIFLLFIFVIVTLFTSGQGTATLSGRVFDRADHLPLAYATITLHSLPDSSLLTGVLSDVEGRFVLSGIKKGSYVLRISFVGYYPVKLPLLIGELNNNYDVGKIELDNSASQLDEVVIQGKKAAISADLDRKTFTVEDNLAQSGSSVLDFYEGLTRDHGRPGRQGFAQGER